VGGAEGEAQAAEEVEDAGEGSVREAVQRDQTQVEIADAGRPAAGERAVGQKGVEVGAVRRRLDGVGEAGQAGVEMSQQLARAEPFDLEMTGEAAFELGGLLLEAPVDGAPGGAGARPALDEEGGDLGVDLARRQIRGDEEALGDEVAAGGLVGPAALVVDPAADSVGEGARRGVALGRPADEIDVEHPTVAVGQERVVEVAGQGVQLIGSGGGEVGAAVAPAGQEGAALLEDGAGGDEVQPAEKVGEAGGLAPVLAQAVEEGGRGGAGCEGEEGWGGGVHGWAAVEGRGAGGWLGGGDGWRRVAMGGDWRRLAAMGGDWRLAAMGGDWQRSVAMGDSGTAAQGAPASAGSAARTRVRRRGAGV
jgi:hypothetical protein